jgi:hypothetical protein
MILSRPEGVWLREAFSFASFLLGVQRNISNKSLKAPPAPAAAGAPYHRSLKKVAK